VTLLLFGYELHHCSNLIVETDCQKLWLGKEAAKTLLGHAEESTTDIYLLEEVQEAMKVAKALARYSKTG